MSSCVANNNHVILSFKYSVNNKNYTIYKITNAKDKCNKIMKKLFERFEEISQLTLEELKNRPKETGYEMIPISDFKINFDNIKADLNLSDDSKIMVFRFNNQKCRILGVKSKECDSLVYIVGYDWDYSAYDHGG